jgi:hypothetical protein
MNSKISHLPKKLRDELGRRIEDGQPGTEIIQWLNNHPEVQAVLEERFAGRPINEQNLSDWKQHGHVEWLWRQESRDAAVRLLEESDDLDDLMHSHSLTERFAALMTGELTRLAIKLLEYEANPDIRWRKVCEINRQLSILRRDEHRLMLIRLKQRQWLARCQASQNRAAAERRPQPQAQTRTEAHETVDSSPNKVNQGESNSNFPHNGASAEPRHPIAPAITSTAPSANGAEPHNGDSMSVNGKSTEPNQGSSILANPAPAGGLAADHAERPNDGAVLENNSSQDESSQELPTNQTSPRSTPPIIPRLPKPAAPAALLCNTILRVA